MHRAAKAGVTGRRRGGAPSSIRVRRSSFCSTTWSQSCRPRSASHQASWPAEPAAPTKAHAASRAIPVVFSIIMVISNNTRSDSEIAAAGTAQATGTSLATSVAAHAVSSARAGRVPPSPPRRTTSGNDHGWTSAGGLRGDPGPRRPSPGSPRPSAPWPAPGRRGRSARSKGWSGRRSRRPPRSSARRRQGSPGATPCRARRRISGRTSTSSSRLRPITTSRPSLPNFSWTARTWGNSARQGPHQVAQKSSRTYFPR